MQGNLHQLEGQSSYRDDPPIKIFSSQAIRIGRKPKSDIDNRPVAILPDFLPERGWRILIKRKGYLSFDSRAKKLKRHKLAHRAAVEYLLGRSLTSEEHVHHQNFNKLHCCPCNLIIMHPAFNISHARRDPYTGQYMTMDQWEHRYGVSDVPDWVTQDYGDL